MRTKARVLLTAVAIFAVSSVANGALIVRDWQTAGDGALTYDTETSLQWLDLTASSGRSFSDVFTQLGAGGNYEGFRYASEQEVRTLFSDAGIPDLSGAWNSANYQPVLALQSLIGVTLASFGASFGATGDQGSDPLSVVGVGLQQQSNPLSSVFEQAMVIRTFVDIDRSAFLGHWLVTQIAEPPTYVLMLAGFVGLAGLMGRWRVSC